MIEGNERPSWILMVTSMALNGFDVKMTTELGLQLTLGLAADELSLGQAASLIRQSAVKRG